MPQRFKKESVDEKDEPTSKKIGSNVAGAVEQVQQKVERGRAPWYRVLLRTQVLAATCIVAFLLFGLLAGYVYFNPVLAIDVFITREFQENQNPWFQALMIFVSWLGNYPLLFSLLVALTGAVFWLVRLRLEALYIIALSGVSTLLNIGLKVLINRPRPNASLVEVLQVASGKSFPSGHVMSYMAYWGLLFALGFILFKRDRWWHYALLVVPAFFVILVGPSRIYLGDHWVSDVLGAYMLGGLLLGMSLWIYLNLKQRGITLL
jgi:membrane-associated phospholipid phosphatase